MVSVEVTVVVPLVKEGDDRETAGAPGSRRTRSACSVSGREHDRGIGTAYKQRRQLGSAVVVMVTVSDRDGTTKCGCC